MSPDLIDSAVRDLQNWSALLENRITELEKISNNAKYDDPLQSASHINRNIYLIRSLHFFQRISIFLIDKLQTDAINSQMYLCQVRTLADILSKILHLLSLDVVAAARVALCEDSVNSKKIHEEMFSKHYDEFIFDNPVFTSVENFPEKDKISRKRFEKIQKDTNCQLLFPQFEDRLDDDFISSITFNINSKYNVSLVGALTHAHTSFSQHVHGNHFFNKPHGNEIFWLVTYTLILIPYTCEILDKTLLNREKAADIRSLLISTLRLKEEISKTWKLKI